MNTTKHVAVLDRITAERRRQEDLKAAGRFKFTCADPELTHQEKLAVLVEEVGEIGREVLAFNGLVQDGRGTEDAFRTELIQVAAVAVAWLESLE